jgi:hypothetical protein
MLSLERKRESGFEESLGKARMLDLDEIIKSCPPGSYIENYDFKKDPLGLVDPKSVEEARVRSINLQRRYNDERSRQLREMQLQEKKRIEERRRRCEKKRLGKPRSKPRAIPKKTPKKVPEKKESQGAQQKELEKEPLFKEEVPAPKASAGLTALKIPGWKGQAPRIQNDSESDTEIMVCEF